MSSDKSALDESAIENFRKYLKIPSVQPNVNYDSCVDFVREQAESLGLPVNVYEPVLKKPIVVITWEGLEPGLPSILLNGHMDVVPVYAEKWKHPPFDAHMDESGDIYARGCQDMKNLSIQFVEAIRRLKLNGVRLKRTIHVSFVPDEEIGGVEGMKAFVDTEDFKSLNVGFAFDEGVVSPLESMILFYGERCKWDVWIHCTGKSGHGSMMHEATAGEKLYKIIDSFMKFRESENNKLKTLNLKPGDVTAVNLTMVKGGVQINVIPEELSVGFDVRLAPDVDHAKFREQIEQWCKEAGEGVHFTIKGDGFVESTKLDDSNPFWMAFKKSCDDNDIQLEPIICPGGTDARNLRRLGIPALGFTPANNTPILLHQTDERLNKDVFLKGIDILMKVIVAVSNV
ncbi:aminoacylase-1-like [Leptopilina heterotoma]|uniref:aminoacylase-1-like n=1 Tax=Leptopilina heterotoma TaxID=63436 RepID=UPI001CA8F22A|nr:aminoacylase-1-like [Leptopilina heterotoma]XP_043465797.1 aminoacylase-1-like [Leptopilina heterotoma]